MNTTPVTGDVRQRILHTGQLIIAGKGFSAVGLNEVLKAAEVPKGSFYHYFGSKEAFGEALLEDYFTGYLTQLEERLGQPGVSNAERLVGYWTNWRDTQHHGDPRGKCLAVKLAAEVSDLSERMRQVLQRGTDRIIAQLALAIEAAVADGSLPSLASTQSNAAELATTLYQLWLGASLRAKITRDRVPLDVALKATYALLSLSPSQERNGS
ncbi:TetR/AcrR family transcriptional regulator [Vreelandella nanhaiensis]|uniref:TetR/AcrR family transcriptional regulator n=1 Tax=Vreelandella nanhaiensis TaxID=1258546 RepID=A0A3S0WBS4_9GAMM|nr:TetR/AcrR family transcriptional regulator [Halomonas nanhaiensis]RUR34346.1 TetR/AcrR family transcriptional regulator [Halomonas nanhaiensis]